MRKATLRRVEADTVVWDCQSPTSRDDKDPLQDPVQQAKTETLATLKEIEYLVMAATENEEPFQTHERCLTLSIDHPYRTLVYKPHQMAHMARVGNILQLGLRRAWTKY